MNKKQQLSSIPETWIKSLSIRPPDFRAIIAAWVDPNVRRKGLSIYEEMMLDPQVSASLNLLKFASLSLDFSVAPRDGSENSRAGEIAKEVQAILESFPGGFNEFLYNTLTALDYGWSITELVWSTNGKKKWAPSKWVPLPQAIYGFNLDEKTGEPDGVRTWFAPMTETKVWPLENFFVLRWNSRFGSPYGRSQLLSAYEPWWVKQLLRRMRNTTLDRFGSPLLIAKVPKNWDEEKRGHMEEFIQNLYAEAGLIVDEGVAIEAVHAGAGQGAAQGFQQAIDYEDAQISKGITGATLNSNESRGTGTYAQAKVHQDNFLYWVGRVSKMLQEAVQKQIVDRYCRYNYNMSEEETPVITFASPEMDQINEIVTMVTQLTATGYLDPQADKDWVREKLNIPPSEDGEGGSGSDRGDLLSRLLGIYNDNDEGEGTFLEEGEEMPLDEDDEKEESLTGIYS